MTSRCRKRRWFALAAALALAVTLAFPSAAAPLLGGPVDTTTGDGVELVPAEDSEYATVGPDGELTLDLTSGDAGLNPGSVTTFGEAFYVRYTGEQYAEVWVTADSAAVSFAVDGQPAGSAAERVRVGPDEAVPVSVRVDTTTTTGGDLDVGGLTVHSRVAEPDGGTGTQTDESTTDTTTTTDATADETEVSIPAVQRRGTAADGLTFTMLAPTAGDAVTLDTDGMVVAGEPERGAVLESLTVTPASGEGATVDVERAAVEPVPREPVEPLGAVRVDASTDIGEATFRLAVDDAFLADVAVDGVDDLALYRHGGDGEWREVSLSAVAERNGSTILEGATGGFSTFVLAADRPEIGVSGASVSPDAVSANGSATVSATLRNDGQAAGERTVPVTVGGEVVAERTVALAPGETATVTASVSPGPGEHTVSVGGVDAGTLVVAADEGGDPTGSDGEDTDESGPGTSEAATDSSDGPPEDVQSEPAGFDFETLAGAGVAVALVVVGVGVLRRRRGGES